MSPHEEILIRRMGCLAHAIVAFISSNPENNSVNEMQSRLGITRRSISPAIKNLIARGVIREGKAMIGLKAWKKQFTVQPETEWKIQ